MAESGVRRSSWMNLLDFEQHFHKCCDRVWQKGVKLRNIWVTVYVILEEQRAEALVLAGPDISPWFILATINLSLLSALGASAIVRIESCRVGVWLTLGVVLMTRIPVSYAFTYQSNLRPPYTISPTAKTMVNSIIGGMIIMFLMISAPIWLYTLWKLRHRWMTWSKVLVEILCFNQGISLN